MFSERTFPTTPTKRSVCNEIFTTKEACRRAKLGQIQGGCRGPAKIRQRGGCNIFFTFYALKIELLEFLREAIKKGLLLKSPF